MNSFKDVSYTHLSSEPQEIVQLAQYNTAENPIDILDISGVAGMKQMTPSFVSTVLPVFLLNVDAVDFESSIWHDVVLPLKALVKEVIIDPQWHYGGWRFVNCFAGKTNQFVV